jgi:hypothetical protein
MPLTPDDLKYKFNIYPTEGEIGTPIQQTPSMPSFAPKFVRDETTHFTIESADRKNARTQTRQNMLVGGMRQTQRKKTPSENWIDFINGRR